MKNLLTACLLTTALCGASHAATLFDFNNNSDLNSALDDQAGPVSFTNSGLIATFTASDGTMNRTSNNGLGINSTISGDDTAAFDVGEWIDITFESAVTLSNINVSSWSSANGDEATISVNGVSNGVITSTGSHDFDISVPTGQVLRIEGTAGSVGNGWELESILIEPAAPIGNLAPVLKEIGDKAVVVSNELSFTVSATDLNNSDDLVLSAAGLPSGAVFNTVTNSGGSVSNTFIWTEASPTGTYSVTFTADDGITNDSETITITVTEEPVLPESVTFDFMGDAALYGALDDQTGPITYTNNGLVATFATVNGEMNRTSSGFGINTSDTTADDTDGFDTNEWIDITFDIPVVLTNVAVGSWNDGADQAVLYVNSVSNGVITTDGNTAFDLIIPALQTLRIAATTNTILDNGWSLDSITVRTDTNAPPVPNTLPIIDPIDDRLLIEGDSVSFSVSASDADLDDIILSASKLPSGASFNTVTNAGAVTNSFTWPAASPAGEYNVTFTADDGTTNVSETVAITVIEQPKLLISEVADPAGSGGGNYRFVELWNAGTNTLDLAAGGWTLSMQDNGDPGDWRDVALTGSVGPTGTYVVAFNTTNFQAAYGFAPDQEAPNVIEGNGRDTYALFYGGNHSDGLLIDIYGEIDVDGTNSLWTYEDDQAERNNPVLEPNPVWTASEWTITVNTETNELNPGIHGPEPEFIPALQDQEVTLGDTLLLTVTATNAVYSDEVITLSATALPAGATFPTVEGPGTVSGVLNWSPTNTGYYSASFAAAGIVGTTTDSITIHVVEVSVEPPVISLSVPAGGPITLSWPAGSGSAFNVLTNSNLLDTNGWGNANLTPFLDGDSYSVTNSIGSEPELFYKLESQ